MPNKLILVLNCGSSSLKGAVLDNQSGELLFSCLAEKLNLPYADALVRTRHTVQQSVLEGAARRTNLRNAFECRVDLTGRRVLLVDDVYTTGTTARECAKALRKAGARNVYLLAYSAGGR